MAIYKLEDIANYQRGRNEKNDNFAYSLEGYPVISAGTRIKGLINGYNRDGFFICISSSGANAGHVTIMNEKFYAADCFTLSAKNKVINKYLGYIFEIKRNFIFSQQKGSAQPHVYWKDIKNEEVFIPNLLVQKQIIDIIEPIEKMVASIEKQLLTISNFFKNHSKNYSNILIKDVASFDKGKLPSGSGLTPFLNVSAANAKINRYVENEPNVFIGDVTLSLDGNTGLVNNSLEGFNGYLYKITPQKKLVKNFQLYYSLLADVNQKIIKDHETGTTIKHASNAKNFLKLLDLPNYFEFFYDAEILLKKQLKYLKKILLNSIGLLIQ